MLDHFSGHQMDQNVNFRSGHATADLGNFWSSLPQYYQGAYRTAQKTNIWYSMTSLDDIIMMSWVIWCWYVCDYDKLTNQNMHSHGKHPFDFQQPIGIEVPTQGIHGHSCDLLSSNRNVHWLMNPVMWFQLANWKCVLTDKGFHVIFTSQSESSKGIMW